MSKDLKIIGLNLGDHDGGCALFVEDSVIYGVAEERLNRHKYSSGWFAALVYCLQAAGLTIDEIDLFVFSSCGKPLSKGYTGLLASFGINSSKCIVADHHLSHALGAFAMSPFDDALVVIMDGMGNNNDTESYYLADKNSISRIGCNDPMRPHWKGVGTTYEAFTNFLGFSDLEAGKVMALAAYGDAQHFEVPLFNVDRNQVIGRLDGPHQHGVLEYGKKNGLAFGDCYPADKSEIAWHIAAYVQYQTELAITQLINNLIESTGKTKVCVSGGVALNCVANTRIRSMRIPVNSASDSD